MINKMTINNIGTYTEPVEIHPKKINFIYGSNGSGKTTISNILGGFTNLGDSDIQYSDENNQQILVYNNKFVE